MYREIVITKWPVIVAFVPLFVVFFHYANRHQLSFWMEFVGGAIIYVACTAAYMVLRRFVRRSGQFDYGTLVLVTGGKHKGRLGDVVGINSKDSSRRYTVEFGHGNDDEIEESLLSKVDESNRL